MYSAGRDGDLRDIWRRVTGEIPLEKKASSSGTATLMTVLGKEDISEHNIAGVTKEIAVVGTHLQEHNARRVAVYLPNGLEFLVALFAGAFYGFTPILIPYNQPHAALIELLQATKADALIAQAGSLPLADVTQRVPALRQIVWTVAKTSRHMDWSEVPEGIGGKVDVSVWHELIQDSKHTEPVLPSDRAAAPGVVFLWQEAVGKPAEMVEFSQQVRLLIPNSEPTRNNTDYHDRTLLPPSARSSPPSPPHNASPPRTPSSQPTPSQTPTASASPLPRSSRTRPSSSTQSPALASISPWPPAPWRPQSSSSLPRRPQKSTAPPPPQPPAAWPDSPTTSSPAS